jgi:hypothetical protein
VLVLHDTALGAACAALDVSDINWVPGVVARLKQLLLDADRCVCAPCAALWHAPDHPAAAPRRVFVAAVCCVRRHCVRAQLEAQLSGQQATWLSGQLAASRAAAERYAGLWQAAERSKAALAKAAAQRVALGAPHAVERMALQVSGHGLCVLHGKGYE